MERWIENIRDCKRGNNFGKKIILNDKQKEYILNNLKGEKLEDVLKEWDIVKQSPVNKFNFGFVNSVTPNEISIKDRGPDFRIRYKYNGPNDNKNRDFCNDLINRNEIYRWEDIKEGMENKDFGQYNIFLYAGSYNCRHNWESIVLRRKLDNEGNPIGKGKNVKDMVERKDEGGIIPIDKRPERQKLIDNNKSNLIKQIINPQTQKEKDELNNLLNKIFIERITKTLIDIKKGLSIKDKELIDEIMDLSGDDLLTI